MSKKVELLSPAGNFEKALAAINNGADAIYLAYQQFGARVFADNFDEEHLKEIIEIAHLQGVKVYVTFNTLVFADELERAKKVIAVLYRNNVDGLIVQDLGALHYIRKTYPDLECHASTQMHLYNADSLWFLYGMGLTRVVLARECTIEKINSFKDIPIEKEVFIHGSLCISFSGQCLISSLNFHRSGNKGACAQSCRLQYDLIDETNKVYKHGYLLSPKDMMTLEHIPELLKAGIDSFKIEGRMKSKEYAGMVTRIYRRAIDQGIYELSNEEMDTLKIIYNRTYTSGHLFHDNGDQLMNHFRPNHQGIEIGKVVEVSDHFFKILLTKDLDQYDGIRIVQDEDYGFTINKMYQNQKLINHANAGEYVTFDKYAFIKKGAKVLKTSSQVLEKKESVFNDHKRQRPINFDIVIRVGEPIKVKAIVDDIQKDFSLEMESDFIVDKAQKMPISDENVIKAFSKLHDTAYYLKDIKVNNDNQSFISLKMLNELRRQIIEKVNNLILSSYQKPSIEYSMKEPVSDHKKIDENYEILVSVTNAKQAEAALKFDDVKVFSDNYELCQKYNLNYLSSNVYEKDYENVEMASELGGVKPGKYLDYNLNINNNEALELLEHYGIKGCILSNELTNRALSVIDYNRNFKIGKVVYGKLKAMSMLYCDVNHIIKNNNKHNCDLCKKQKYYLKDMKKQKFYLLGDDDCNMHLYNHEPINKIAEIDKYKEFGLLLYRVVFSDENANEVTKILNEVRLMVYGK